MLYEAPFPHAVIDGFVSSKMISAINKEWPDHSKFQKENGKAQIKWNTNKVTDSVASVIHSINVSDIENITGLSNLIADPDLCGGGMHCIPRGGFLKMHVDFNGHPHHNWTRKVNLLIYVHQYWDTSWNGALCLGAKQEKKIDPLPGRAVIFETNDQSWHGHPEPLKMP
jgi:Rps23 Pro-64 3,4-dihydroxylase Tpa1-like proline 4-hydroxylase